MGPETIEETAALVDQAGGRGIAVQVDHLDSTVAMNARMMEPEAIASVRIRRLDGASTWKYIDE